MEISETGSSGSVSACVVKTYPSIDPIVAPPDLINI